MSTTTLTIRCKVCNTVISTKTMDSMGEPVKLDRLSVCVKHIPPPSK